jgi:hypothetical protein
MEWQDRLLDTWADLSRPENIAIDGKAADRRWRPNIHIPRWASRLTLENTEVRVERVQDITLDDMLAEGIAALPEWEGNQVSTESCWRSLWDSINGPRGYGWDANPWVWVVSFRVV